MESAAILQTIAEVAVGLAGFGGIAAGLGYRVRGEWSDQDKTRLTGMAVSSLMVVFACLIPYAFHHLGLPAPWTFSSILLIWGPAWFLSIQVRQVYAWSRSRGLYIRAGFKPSFALMLTTANVLALLLLVVSSLGFTTPDRTFGIYLSAVLLLLFAAAANFLRLLRTSFGDERA